MVDRVDMRATLVVTGGPELDALELRGEIDTMLSELGRGRGDADRARDLCRRGRAIAMHLGPGDQAYLLEQVERLERAIATERPTAPERPERLAPTSARSRPSVETAARRELEQTLRRLPTDPQRAREVVRDLTLRSMNGLARMSSAELDRTLAGAGLSADQRELVKETIARTIGTSFHRQVVEEATRSVANLADRLSRAQSGAGFEQIASQMWGPQRMPLLRGLERCGARSEVDELERLLDQVDIDPSRREELMPQIREALRAALSAAADGVSAMHEQLVSGGFAYDDDGLAYTLFPAAVERVATRMGVPAGRAATLAEGRATGDSVLEDAIARDVSARRDTRHDAERVGQVTFLATAIATSVMTGGSTASMLIGIGLSGLEVAGAFERADQLDVAAAADLNTEDAADEARDEAEIALGAAAMSVATGVALHGATHGAHGAAEEVSRTTRTIHAAAEELPNAANGVRHEVHRQHAERGH